MDGRDCEFSRSFALISVHLSRALGWDVGQMVVDWAGFGGDIGGFGGEVFGMVHDGQNQAPYQSTG